jgi:flagellin-like protein
VRFFGARKTFLRFFGARNTLSRLFGDRETVSGFSADRKAVSPVVGVALLLAITVILATVVGSVLLGVGVGPAGEPETTLSFAVSDDDTILLRHEGGDPLDPDEIVVVDESRNALQPGLDSTLETGERQEIVSSAELASLGTDERISVIWRNPGGNGERILATFEP